MNKITLALVLLLMLACNNINAQAKDTMVIVCFGNSTTAPRKNIEKVYPQRLQEYFLTKGIPARIFNAGIPGSHAGSINENAFHKVAHGLDRFDTAVQAKNPDWVIISFGINDAWQDGGANTRPRISLELFKKHLCQYIDAIQAGGGKPILMTPNPLGNKFEAFRNMQLKKYMNQCIRVAQKNKLALVDTWKIFQQASKKDKQGLDKLLLDGMHPNDNGHVLMADAIIKIITAKQDNEYYFP